MCVSYPDLFFSITSFSLSTFALSWFVTLKFMPTFRFISYLQTDFIHLFVLFLTAYITYFFYGLFSRLTFSIKSLFLNCWITILVIIWTLKLIIILIKWQNTTDADSLDVLRILLTFGADCRLKDKDGNNGTSDFYLVIPVFWFGCFIYLLIFRKWHFSFFVRYPSLV